MDGQTDTRRKLVQKANALIQEARTNMGTLAEEIGVSHSTLRVLLSQPDSRLSLGTYLPKLADALETKGGRMQEIAAELRELAEEVND